MKKRKRAYWHVYKGKRGWYWKLTAPNGKIIALGGEPFKSWRNAVRAVTRVIHTIPLADWSEKTIQGGAPSELL